MFLCLKTQDPRQCKGLFTRKAFDCCACVSCLFTSHTRLYSKKAALKFKFLECYVETCLSIAFFFLHRKQLKSSTVECINVFCVNSPFSCLLKDLAHDKSKFNFKKNTSLDHVFLFFFHSTALQLTLLNTKTCSV